MRSIYKIANVKIEIIGLKNGKQENYIENFNSNAEKHGDVKCNVIRVNKFDNNFDKDMCEYMDLNVVKLREKLIWRFLKPGMREEYCRLVQNNEKDYQVLINRDEKEVFPNIGDIFKYIDLQGILLKRSVMILHSNFIIHNNNAILFTAPSGTGKSTQGALWERYKNAEVINGDRACIAIKDNEYYAYGLPFSGSSGISKNKEAKIKAIVALEQSKENKVRKLSKTESFKILLSQVAINRWNKDEINIAMNLIEKLIENIPVIILYCRPDKEATDVLEKYLNDIYKF